jgi:hypothetical protein
MPPEKMKPWQRRLLAAFVVLVVALVALLLFQINPGFQA